MNSFLKYCTGAIFCLTVIHGTVRGQDPNNLKEYTLVIYLAGEQRDHNEEEVKDIQKGHLEHLTDMAESGLLSIAGPFSASGEWRGLLIFNTSDTLVVQKALNKDPAVIAGRLNYKMHGFYSTPGRCLE